MKEKVKQQGKPPQAVVLVGGDFDLCLVQSVHAVALYLVASSRFSVQAVLSDL